MLRVGVELHVLVADVPELGLHVRRRRRVRVEVLVELPEAVERLEGDVERALAISLGVDALRG